MSSSTTENKPRLDVDSFQKLLAAAYVLQEHNERLRPAPADSLEHEIRAWPQSVPQRESQNSPPAANALAQPPAASHAEVQSGYTRTLAEIVELQQQIQTSQLDLQHSMDLIVERVRQITHASGVAIGLVENGNLLYRAASGAAACLLGSSINTAACLSASCLNGGFSFQSPDTVNDPKVPAEACRQLGVKSLIAVPVHYDQKIAGCIELHFAGPNAFEEHDVRTAQLMAGLMTEAMARAAEFQWKQALASERASMLAALEKLKPQLRRLAGEPGSSGADDGDHLASPGPASCLQCGKALDEGQLVCGSCGTPRTQPRIPHVQSKWASLWHLSQAQTKQPLATDLSEAGLSGQTEVPPDPDAIPALPQATLGVSHPQEQVLATNDRAAELEAVLPLANFKNQAPTQDGTATAELSASARESGSEELSTSGKTTDSNPDEKPVDAAEAAPDPQSEWASATKARAWLESLQDGEDDRPFARFWKERRADIYLVLAVIMVLVVIRWGIWSNDAPSAAASGTPPTRTFLRKRQLPPAPKLSFTDKMLVNLGLAEPPPPPVYNGNPEAKVWVDLRTALYYCPGSDLYGKTPKGKFTSQRDAQLDQFEPAYRKACD
jgi:putative methionine-R-sulfoxide reductase with GAF domain